MTVNATYSNGEYVLLPNGSGVAVSDGKIHTEKQKKVEKPKPKVTITAKPSCGCRYSYRWHTTTFVNYCPHCHRYGTLYNKHKYGARHEHELTCRYDDCDYCGVCGKEKYSWSSYRLTKSK